MRRMIIVAGVAAAVLGLAGCPSSSTSNPAVTPTLPATTSQPSIPGLPSTPPPASGQPTIPGAG